MDADRSRAVASLLEPGAIRSVRQPIVRVGDRCVVGWEALSRFDGGGGFATPLDAFSAAQACGLGRELEFACLSAAQAGGAAPEGGRLFLNTSPALLLDDRFAAVVPSLPPHVLEITEHEPVHDYGPLRDRLEQFRASGTLIAVDDVGAGYATMAHVVRLAPAFIKIDRSLVSGIHLEPDQRALVAALVAFAGQVGATCIAEGVEQAAELDVLEDLGVDLAQGFLLARPGEGWPQPEGVAARGRALPVGARAARPLERVRELIAATSSAAEVAEIVCRFLARDGTMLPSVYLWRAGLLRCIARSGQWHVLDGMPAGVGITGQAFACAAEVVARDVTQHPTYRPAHPGVQAEFAAPIMVDGEVAGVLNADCLRSLSDSDVAVLRSCISLLGRRLSEIGAAADRTTLLQELSRVAREATTHTEEGSICERAVATALRISRMDTAALLRAGDGGIGVAAVTGRHTSVLEELSIEQITAISDLVDGVASVHTGGGSLDASFGPMGVLRDRGVRSVIVAPLHAAPEHRGLLMVSSNRTATIDRSTVEAIELLALHIGTTLAASSQLALLHRLAYHDPLTGVGNRSAFDDTIAACVDLPRRPATLALVDIDRFKQINDRFGHAVGDDTLRAVADALTACVGEAGQVFRLGGDEFAVVLRSVSPSSSAILRRSLDRCRAVLGPMGADISVGEATLTHRRSAEQTFAQADRALYASKSQSPLRVAPLGASA